MIPAAIFALNLARTTPGKGRHEPGPPGASPEQ